MSYPKLMDEMVGKEYNDWRIIKARPNNRKGFVLAQCFCGKVKEVRGRSIKDNTSKNCGCRKVEIKRKRIPGHNNALRATFSLYRGKAKRQGKEFNINVHQFQELTSRNCFYCGAIPKNRNFRNNQEYIYNGLDRIDNEKGYTLENIEACCYHCNTLKGGITISMINKIYNRLNKNA
jgi:hypothetical protein